MASDPQLGHLMPLVASLDGIHSRVPLLTVSIDTKHAQSKKRRSHLVHSKLIRIRFLLDGLAMLRLSPSCTPCRVYGMCGPYSPRFREQLFSETASQDCATLCVRTGAVDRFAPVQHPKSRHLDTPSHKNSLAGSENTSSYCWGGSETVSYMLDKSKSRWPQSFTASLAVANMRLPGMRRVGILLHGQPLFPGPRSTHYGALLGHAQFPRRPLLGCSREALYPCKVLSVKRA